MAQSVGNQLPILLISFGSTEHAGKVSWESVTNPLDKLSALTASWPSLLGISYQSS